MNDPEILMDVHNHSNLSPDGSNDPDEMVRRATELGIRYYSLTDHLEINKFYDEEYLYEEPVKRASEISPALIKKYADKINMAYGVELGQPLQDMELTKRMLSSYDYDFIIGSLHMCNGWEDFYLLDYNEVQPEMIMKLYFEEMLEMARWGEFDVLGHLTYPLRYIVGESELYIDLTLPDEYYVRLYKELGGKILTVGSDAHCTQDLGKGIPEAIELARNVGFTELAFFKKRNPTFISIK